MATLYLPKTRKILKPRTKRLVLNRRVWEADGLVGFWPLGAHPDGRDLSLYGNHGTINSDPVHSGSGNRFGLDLDGVDDRVDCGDISHLPANARSWGGWVFLRDDTAELRCVMSHYSGYSGYNMMIDATEQISISIGVGTGHVYQYGGTLDIGKWTHLFTVSNGITLVGYKDGVEYQSRSGGNIADPSNPLWIGSDPTTAGREWPGNLDDIRIYNRALSAQEVSSLYRTTSPGGYGRLLRPAPSVFRIPLSAEEESSSPTVPGIERTADDNRLHARAPDNRLHATADDNRLHVRAKESGY